MPQSGDGGLWPTTDDDEPSASAKDTSNNDETAPEQGKQSAEAPEAAGGWFDPPTAEERGDKAAGRDEPHAEPGQQRTQPVSWPVAELERQAKSLANPKDGGVDAPAALPRPLPAQTKGDEATAFMKPVKPGKPKDAPAWPSAESTRQGQDDSAKFTRSSSAEKDTAGDATANLPKPEKPTEKPAEKPVEEKPAEEKPAAPPDKDETRRISSADAKAAVAGTGQDSPDRPVDGSWFAADTPKTPEARRAEAPRNDIDPPTVHIARPTAEQLSRAGTGSETVVNIPRPQQPKDEWPPPEPPRAAPQRVDPEPAEPEEPKKKSRRPLVIAAIAVVAVVAVAAGVILFVPGLSERLGLTSEEAVAIDPPPAPVNYSPGLRGPAADGPKPTAQGVESALAGPIANPALGTVTGIVIDPVSGETLFERDPGTGLVPASTGKILTAAAALLTLDHTEQLVTKVVQGESPGEVIIVGGGDPTISSLAPGVESIYPGAPHLSDLVDQVKASGVQVDTVYIDQSRYDSPGLAQSWLPADVALGYIAPIVPAMLDGDRQDPNTNYSPRSNNPGRRLVTEFASRIGASVPAAAEKAAPANAKVLGELRSAPMSQLVDNMLDSSENTLGDIIAREIAVKAGEAHTFDGASKAMLDVLRQNQFDVDGVVLRDGSGMSTENRVSANLLAQILAVAAGPDGKDPRTDKLRPLLGGLPVAGGSGTLASRYVEGPAAQGKGWVRAKTGTLTGVNSLAGIVLDKDNRPLVFAFLTSGTAPAQARTALDTVSATLRGCGCQ